MTRRRDAERARERARDLEVLRDAVDNFGGRIYSTDRRVRRLVRRGWAEKPNYTYGLRGTDNATAEITEAGRTEVMEHDKEGEQ
jgi:hypothetical protein